MDETCVVCTATRLEFQEGSRNQTRPYHGTGLPHVHILLWVDSRVHESNIACCARADLGSELLQTAVERQQRSTVDKVPVRAEGTCWEYSGSAWSLKLSHPPDAATSCVQPYLEAVCRAHIGHQCFLTVNSSAHVIEYSTRWTKYATKGTEGLSQEWISGAASGWHAAFSWLTRCQHSAAQMVATLTRTPLVRYSCRTEVIQVSTPDDAASNDLIRKYLICRVRPEDMSFASWCREFRTNCEVPRPYQVRSRGGTACAFQVTSFYKDSYFGPVVSDERSCQHRIISDTVVSWPRSACANLCSVVHNMFTTKTRRMAVNALDAV